MSEKRIIDWESIERDYRAGILSLREIGTLYSITHGAIRKRAEKDGWTRDLRERIQAKAAALVSAALVSSQVSTDTKKATEREIVDANAVKVADVQIAHRRDITRMRLLVLRLLDECEAEAADPSMFRELGEIMRSPDDKGQDKLNDVYVKVISLPVRIKGVKELAETLKVLIGLEREAYGIASIPDVPPDSKTIDPMDVARRIAFGLARAGSQITQ